MDRSSEYLSSDKENLGAFASAAYASDAKWPPVRHSPKSEGTNQSRSGAVARTAAAEWFSDSPSGLKASKLSVKASPSARSRTPLARLEANTEPRLSQSPSVLQAPAAAAFEQRWPSETNRKLNFPAKGASKLAGVLKHTQDLPVLGSGPVSVSPGNRQPLPGPPSVTLASPESCELSKPRQISAVQEQGTCQCDQEFEDQNQHALLPRPMRLSDNDMATRALQNLPLDHLLDSGREAGSSLLRAGGTASSFSVSEATSDEGTAGSDTLDAMEAPAPIDPEKALQEAWSFDDVVMDDFPVYCDETESSYQATESIHALHGLPGPASLQPHPAPSSRH